MLTCGGHNQGSAIKNNGYPACQIVMHISLSIKEKFEYRAEYRSNIGAWRFKNYNETTS